MVAAIAFIHRPKLLFGEQVHLLQFPACTVPRISSSDFVDGWRTKTLGHGSLLNFKYSRLFIAKRAGVLGWVGPGFSCSSPEYRGHSGGPVDISILGRGRLESGGTRAPGPLALNIDIPGASVASRITLKWLQIHYDPEDKSLKGDCDVCAPLYTCSV